MVAFFLFSPSKMISQLKETQRNTFQHCSYLCMVNVTIVYLISGKWAPLWFCQASWDAYLYKYGRSSRTNSHTALWAIQALQTGRDGFQGHWSWEQASQVREWIQLFDIMKKVSCSFLFWFGGTLCSTPSMEKLHLSLVGIGSRSREEMHTYHSSSGGKVSDNFEVE